MQTVEQDDAVWGSKALGGKRLEQVDNEMANEMLGSKVKKSLRVVIVAEYLPSMCDILGSGLSKTNKQQENDR